MMVGALLVVLVVGERIVTGTWVMAAAAAG